MQFTWLLQHVEPALGEGEPSGIRVWIAVVLVAVSTIGGAFLARHKSKHVVAWLAIASATMLVVTLTDLLPDAWRDAVAVGVPIWAIGVAAAVGFLAITYLTREDYGLEVASDEEVVAQHAPGRHRRLKEAVGAAMFGGMGTAAALTTHRAIEGATLALSTSAVVVIALMVHSASEGLALAALLDMAEQRMVPWLLVACLSPIAGLLFATFSPLPGRLVPVLLGMVAGVLLRTALVGLRLAVRRQEGERPMSRHLAIAAVVAVSVAALLAMAHEVQRRVSREQHTKFIETFGHGTRPPRYEGWAGPHGGDEHGTEALPRPRQERDDDHETPVARSPEHEEPAPQPTAGSPSVQQPTAQPSPAPRVPAPRTPIRSQAPRTRAPTPPKPAARRTPGAPADSATTLAGRDRTEMLMSVKAGRISLAEVLERKDTTAKRLPVAQLLDALPGCDRGKVAALMASGKVDRKRRVGALTAQQRQRLLKAYATCSR
jgi:zinc transporter ZupT